MLMGSTRSVAVEYPVRCTKCQTDILPGEQHDVVDVADAGATVYWHSHARGRCPVRETRPSSAPTHDPGMSGGEAVAAALGTLAIAGVSYLIGRWRERQPPR
jgi:hypothetical protein